MEQQPLLTKKRRAFKACVHCKSRKLKCDLGDPESPAEPPCARCKRASRECILGTAKERGPRQRSATAPPSRPPAAGVGTTSPPAHLSNPYTSSGNLSPGLSQANYFPYQQPPYYDQAVGSSSGSGMGRTNGGSSNGLGQTDTNGGGGTNGVGGGNRESDKSNQLPGGGEGDDTDSSDDEGQRESNGDILLSSHVTNPGDAFRLLINASTMRPVSTDESPLGSLPGRVDVLSAEECWERWPLVASRLMSQAEASTLLVFFETEMAPLYPLLPPQVFAPEHLRALTSEESLLLAACLAIAARHSPLMIHGREELHDAISKWIRQQLVTLLDGGPRYRHVSTVEALLLLSEWPPLPQSDSSATPATTNTYSSNDDQAAIKEFLQPSNVYDAMSWSYIGFAVRLAQELGLHNDSIYPFERDGQTASWMNERYLRTWLYAYNADRHVSIRLGRNASVQAYMTSAWWEQVTSHHSKMASHNSGTVWTEEAMSQGLLAALMGTIQERLYPDKEITRTILRTGHWESFLRSLEQELKVIRRNAEKFLQQDTVHATLLHIEICYVHLYGNAIALRALQERLKRRMKEPASIYAAPSLLNLAEGPWCIDALAAAQSTLHLTVNVLEPKGYLRLCPSRIFLRILFAATFLFKALAVGVVEYGQSNLLGLLGQTIAALQRSSIDHDHIARGFAMLLSRVQSQCHPRLLSDPKPSVFKTSSAIPIPPSPGPQPVSFNSWTMPAEPAAAGGESSMGFSGLEAFELPWEWDPTQQALEAGRDQDLLFSALWSTDIGASSSNFSLLGTLVGDGFGF